MIAACVVAILIMAAAAGLGGGILRIAGARPDPREGVFSSIALGLGALSLVGFFTGLAGAFYATFAWGLLAIIFAFLWKDVLDRFGGLVRTVRRLLTARRGAFETILLLALLAAVAVNFICALAPPSESDSLTLHLVVPRDYISAHRMVFSPDNWDSAMALGPHMLYTLAILMSGGVIAPGVLHFLVGCVFILWVWQFVRVRFGARAAYAGASVIYNIPMVSHVTIAPMIDMFFALYAFAALVWLLEFIRRPSALPLVLSGISAAFSANVKYTGLIIMASVVIAAAVESALSGRLLRSATACAAAALAAALVSSPFFIRNYAWTGNPVFPTMKETFGGLGWDKPHWQEEASGDARYGILHHSAKNMLVAPWLITTDAQDASGGISESVGPALLAFLPLALLMRSRRRLFRSLAVYALIVFALTYWLSPRPRSRYFLSILPVLAVYVGVGLVLLRRYSRLGLLAGRTVVLASVASGLAVTMLYSVSFAKVVFGLTPQDAFLAQSTDFYGDFKWMEKNLPPGSKVAVGATNNVYYLSLPSMRFGTSDAYTLVDTRALYGLDESGSPETASRRMKALGITHLFLSEGYLSQQNTTSASGILRQMLNDSHLEKVYAAEGARGTRNPLARPEKESVAVYRVVYERGS